VTKVRVPPTLREQTGGERELAAVGETVRELLDDLMSRFPTLQEQLPFVNVYVEGEDVRTLDGVDTEVKPGSTVILLPAMAGGFGGVWGNLPVPPDPLHRSASRTGGFAARG
jgi:molybdopterin converting factor small subunit